MAVVDVADVEPGALAREAARAEGRQAALRGQLGQRVRLVHELAELAAAEELLHRRHDRADVDERVRGRLVDLLDRHALAHDALHAQQADPERVLDQLAVGADAAVAEVVDVVLGVEPAVALDQVADDRGDVLAGDRAAVARQLDAHAARDAVELLVELVPADATEVVPAEVEEQALDELARVVTRGRIARAQLLVDLDEGFLLRVGDVLVERVRDVRVLGIRVDRREQRADLVVVLVADGAQQRGRRDLALAVDLDPELVLVVGLELEPRAAVRDHLGAEQAAAARGVLELAVVDARAADELAHDDALGAVDDERPLVGHRREVAHVDTLALDLAGLLDQELDVDVERARVGEVLGPALQLAVLRRTELVVEELELHHLAGEVLDRADLVEQLAQALVDEPPERVELQLDQVRDRQDLGDPGVRIRARCWKARFDDVSAADSMNRSLTEERGKGRTHELDRIPQPVAMSTARMCPSARSGVPCHDPADRPVTATRRRILFLTDAMSLAHVARPFVLASTLDPARFEVHVAAAPGALTDLVLDGAPFRRLELRRTPVR